MAIEDDELMDFGGGPLVFRVREKKIEAAGIAYAVSRGWTQKKVGTNAWPDRLFLRKFPEMVWVEFKRPGESLRPNQEKRVAAMRSRGYRVEVIDSKEQFANAFGA